MYLFCNEHELDPTFMDSVRFLSLQSRKFKHDVLIDFYSLLSCSVPTFIEGSCTGVDPSGVKPSNLNTRGLHCTQISGILWDKCGMV